MNMLRLFFLWLSIAIHVVAIVMCILAIKQINKDLRVLNNHTKLKKNKR